MPLPIENYALIGDCHTAALVGIDGSIDWLCLPRFDSGACFAALLGGPEHGRWLLAPAGELHEVRRKYRGDTLILETEFDTEEGSVRVIDFMPLSDRRWDIVRIVEGLRGRSAHAHGTASCDSTTVPSFPGCTGPQDILLLTAGPDTLELAASVAVEGENMHSVAEFRVNAGGRESFVLNYRPSHLDTQSPVDADEALAESEKLWQEWTGRCSYRGRWRGRRGALADHPEGAHVQADRRNDRGAHHLLARAAGRRAQLGLPLLLAARRDVHLECAAARRL